MVCIETVAHALIHEYILGISLLPGIQSSTEKTSFQSDHQFFTWNIHFKLLFKPQTSVSYWPRIPCSALHPRCHLSISRVYQLSLHLLFALSHLISCQHYGGLPQIKAAVSIPMFKQMKASVRWASLVTQVREFTGTASVLYCCQSSCVFPADRREPNDHDQSVQAVWLQWRRTHLAARVPLHLGQLLHPSDRQGVSVAAVCVHLTQFDTTNCTSNLYSSILRLAHHTQGLVDWCVSLDFFSEIQVVSTT